MSWRGRQSGSQVSSGGEVRSSLYNLVVTAQGQGGTLGPGEPQHSELSQISRAVHGTVLYMVPYSIVML